MKFSLISLFLMVNSPALIAQDTLRNTGNLQVHAGASVAGYGNFINTATAVFTNNGNLYLKGNLVNDEIAMSAGTGTLYLNGTVQQQVNGSQVFRTFNLNTNNSAGILLNNELDVSGAHTFTAGLIASSLTPNYLVYEDGSSYSGDNDSRHVTGWVKKIGSSGFTFPVGDGTYERVAALSALSGSAEFNCKYYTPGFNIFNLASPLVQVRSSEYWQMDKVSGGSARVTLNWDHAKVPMDNVLLSDITTAYYTGGSWTDAGGVASGNVTTTGSVTSNLVSNFGSFTLGYKSFPVPLKLISFTGERTAGITMLRWITENEENMNYFEVERSFDGTGFSSVAVQAARNRGQREIYTMQDPVSFRGLAYYRLRSIDRDGKFSFSKVIVVSETDASGGGFLVINPVRTHITILNRTGREGRFNYRLYNLAGQQVLEGTATMTASGGTVLTVPGQTANGLYILELTNAEVKFSQKILIGR